MDYKNTLNLPQTEFPMKADLVTREPARLKKWETTGLYAAIQAERAGADQFVLHHGPPFANAGAPDVAVGHSGGLPIEFKVSGETGKAGDTASDAALGHKLCDLFPGKAVNL